MHVVFCKTENSIPYLQEGKLCAKIYELPDDTFETCLKIEFISCFYEQETNFPFVLASKLLYHFYKISCKSCKKCMLSTQRRY